MSDYPGWKIAKKATNPTYETQLTIQGRPWWQGAKQGGGGLGEAGGGGEGWQEGGMQVGCKKTLHLTLHWYYNMIKIILPSIPNSSSQSWPSSGWTSASSTVWPPPASPSLVPASSCWQSTSRQGTWCGVQLDIDLRKGIKLRIHLCAARSCQKPVCNYIWYCAGGSA